LNHNRPIPPSPTPEQIAASARYKWWAERGWLGVPKPLRLRVRSPFYFKSMPGCGCSARLKMWAFNYDIFKETNCSTGFCRAMWIAIRNRLWIARLR
jgi:hypothetical protein